jgi:hypothetical protein
LKALRANHAAATVEIDTLESDPTVCFSLDAPAISEDGLFAAETPANADLDRVVKLHPV